MLAEGCFDSLTPAGSCYCYSAGMAADMAAQRIGVEMAGWERTAWQAADTSPQHELTATSNRLYSGGGGKARHLGMQTKLITYKPAGIDCLRRWLALNGAACRRPLEALAVVR